jgi:hypothetical protein
MHTIGLKTAFNWIFLWMSMVQFLPQRVRKGEDKERHRACLPQSIVLIPSLSQKRLQPHFFAFI